MDLHDRIAARRKELGEQAKKLERERAAVELAEKIALEREAAEKAGNEVATINSEVENRLKAQGLASLAAQSIDETKVNAAVDKVISQAASSRMTSLENGTFAVLLIVGLLMFFVAWPIAVAIIILAVWYASNKTEMYKAQIIAEGLVAKEHATESLVQPNSEPGNRVL